MILALTGERSYFDVLVTGGGGIGYVIIALSVAMCALAVRYLVHIRRSILLPDQIRTQLRDLLARKEYRKAIEASAATGDLLSGLVHAALIESVHGYDAMERAMEETAEARSSDLMRRIEWLNLIGNVSPMLGLLGTVWGMINSFFSIASSARAATGAVDISAVSGGIAVALVTTLQGLCVAIPALAVYGFVRNRIDTLTSEAMLSAEELMSPFRHPRSQ